MNYLVLLRHGESRWNLENRFTGFTDVELSDKGVAEAKEAGHRLAHISFDKVYTSTLKRAINTAILALDASGDKNTHLRHGDAWEMTRRDELKERDYGGLTGMNKDEARKAYGEEQVHIWRRSYDVPPPEGESLADVVERVRPYFQSNIWPDVQAGKNVLVAAHGNSLRAMLIILGENTPENINKAEMPTGAPLVFEYEGGRKVNKYFLQDDLVA